MTIKNFLVELGKAIKSLKLNESIAATGFYYAGVNNKDSYGSPGGSWNPKDFPAFVFTNNDETFLLRLAVSQNNKIIIESTKQRLIILNYELNQDNFSSLDSTNIEIRENFKMTVRHSIKRETVKKALYDVGMSSEIIYSGNTSNVKDIIGSLISWAITRSEAKKLIRDFPKDGKPIPTEVLNSNSNPLNLILYGPPGTGKTYSTIEIALKLLGDNVEDSRQNRKKRFSEFQKQGRIYFTTFHQNMAYEDFIEGIKPVEPEEEEEFLKYEIQDGLFMRACIEATYSYLVSRSKNDKTNIQSFLDYNALFDSLFEQVSENGTMQLSTRAEGTVTASITTQGNFAVRHEGKEKSYSVSRERLSVLYEKFPDLTKIANITNEFRNAIGGCNSTAYWSVLNKLKELSLQNKKGKSQPIEILDPDLGFDQKKAIVKKYWSLRDTEPVGDSELEPFVFIIDEINRGNVSQIFGELITLIEDDKRIGKPEVIYIDLPYSKRPFAIPPNLHIIGTMNTADRSVEALDTALRRRFVFHAKLPEPEELPKTTDGIELKNLLSNLNNRLRILKDSDHTIGHAWLWDIKNTEELKAVFGSKILPLLQEYFYNDYEKLGLVLGDSFFVLPHKRTGNNEFAAFTGGNNLASQYRNKFIYELKPVAALQTADFITLCNLSVDNEVE